MNADDIDGIIHAGERMVSGKRSDCVHT